jgi:Zn-dependent protease with chaperone function/uncharacterized tellurite resistance protein B-like protein
MDFFERQDKARRNTKVLVFYFTVAVVLLVGATYVAVFATFLGGRFKDSIASAGEPSVSLWQPDLFLWTALATLGVILIGSVTKTLQLNRGGSAVAEMLDGRLINSNSTDPDERKLLNIVEEMAIASGVPVPQVYVMNDEAGINAFSAGFSTSDAAVGVTRGCMKKLSRDELQGVIGHEFSHILNGDMRLNLRLMGLIFGILCLTVVGRVLLRTRGRKNPLPLLGLALVIIGFVGVFFGRLIQAAVSRQREFLADASAVQFTRNPGGLAGALKKIGGLKSGSRLASPHAEEASHLFFANGMGSSLFGIMATHPPLSERILALDPNFDGEFPTVAMEDAAGQTEPPHKTPPVSRPPIPVPGFPSTQIGTGGLAVPIIAMQSVVPNVGQPAIQHLRYAVDLRKAIAPALEAAAREPLGASALLCALLLSDDPSARRAQLEELGRALFDPLSRETARIWTETQTLPAQARIPLIDLALPALRRLSLEQFQQFRGGLQTLVESDRQISLFEYMLQKIVLRHLEPYFLPARKRVTQFHALRPLVGECGVLLSAMAYAGQKDSTEAQGAFARGAKPLSHAAQAEIPFVLQDQCDLPQIDSALERLSQAVPQIKKNLLNACAETIAADGMIHEREAELIRAIADALDCPLPPFVEAQENS